MKLLKFIPTFLIVFSFIYSCSSSEDSEQEVELEKITHRVLLWEFTPDTGNETSRLRYEIEFHNPNDKVINGFYRITQNADGLVTTLISSNKSPCYEIGANSSCTVSFDGEDSFDIARIQSIELISVEYNLEQ